MARVAVDHWYTDNPHTHIVLRGRDDEGRVLGLPRVFVKHGLRDIARDAATERLGPRSRDQERDALERVVRAHRVTRLDLSLEAQLGPDNRVRLASLGRDHDPAYAQALKSRVVELGRLGLAEEVKRGTCQLAPDWKERLNALEAHVDIRKQVLKDRAHDKAFEKALHALERETGKPAKRLGQTKQDWKVRREVDLQGGRYLALERHDRVALAPKPKGLEISPQQAVSVSTKLGAVHINKLLGLER